MKSLLSGNNKLEPSVNTDKVSQIIRTKSSLPKNKIITVKLNDSEKLATDLLKVCKFEVQESGHYNINFQLALTILAESGIGVTMKTIQYGICQDDLSDFEHAFSSKMMYASCPPAYILSDNLTVMKYLETGKQYCAWCAIGSSNNNYVSYDKDYSHLLLLKICE